MTKLSHSEAGKLGGAQFRISAAKKKKDRINKFNQNPNKCHECNESLTYEKRKNKFCNQSCSALFYNKKRKEIKTLYCLNCNTLYKTTSKSKNVRYCNAKCHQDYQYKERIRKWLEEGISWKDGGANPPWAKKYISEIRGYKCELCDISEWQGLTLTLQLDHINGDSSNHSINNLRLLCPNCHSLTPTYGAKNMGNGRKIRRQRYKLRSSTINEISQSLLK